MLYHLFHHFFGWDYIVWGNSIDQGIARVRVDGRGSVWYWRYPGIRCADTLTDPSKVIWLTCHPSKYFPTVPVPEPPVNSPA